MSAVQCSASQCSALWRRGDPILCCRTGQRNRRWSLVAVAVMAAHCSVAPPLWSPWRAQLPNSRVSDSASRRRIRRQVQRGSAGHAVPVTVADRAEPPDETDAGPVGPPTTAHTDRLVERRTDGRTDGGAGKKRVTRVCACCSPRGLRVVGEATRHQRNTWALISRSRETKKKKRKLRRDFSAQAVEADRGLCSLVSVMQHAACSIGEKFE